MVAMIAKHYDDRITGLPGPGRLAAQPSGTFAWHHRRSRPCGRASNLLRCCCAATLNHVPAAQNLLRRHE